MLLRNRTCMSKTIGYGTYSRLLQQCVNNKALTDSKIVHARIIRTAFEPDVFALNHLVNMYAKCGCVMDARQVFDKMSERNLVSWTAMISGYSQHGYGKEALYLFLQMQYDGMELNQFTFSSILRACASPIFFQQGEQLHVHVIKTGFASDIFVASALVGMYAKCQSVNSSRQVFDEMKVRNVVSWNALIGGYAEHGYCHEAVQLFGHMYATGSKPNCITLTSILSACVGPETLILGEQIHVHIIKNGFDSDLFVGTALIHMYAKSDNLDNARHLFDKLSPRDAVPWTAMISGYAQNGNVEEALKLIQKMQRADLKMNHVALLSVLGACSSPEALEHGKQMHTQVIKIGSDLDVSSGNALVTMYAKCERIEDAWIVFHKMTKRDEVSWTAIISGYTLQGYGDEAFKLFCEMRQASIKPDQFTLASVLKACSSTAALKRGKLVHVSVIKAGYESDIFVGNALIDMYAKCGRVEDACKVFEKMANRDLVTWNGMMGGYIQNGHGDEALEIFCKMLRVGMDFDQFTFGSIISACATPEVLDLGVQIHAHVIKTGCELGTFVGNALVNMYAKCGNIKAVHILFSQMPPGNMVLWTTVIAGYTQHGHGEEALKLLCHMQRAGMKPNKFTFATVTTACAGLAALEQGKLVHAHIIKAGFETNAFVGSALVDMYAKCGSIKKARKLFDEMPEQDVILWNVMIVGYAQHGHGKEAFQLFEQMQQRGMALDHITFVGILSACSHLGLINEAYYYFNSMSLNHSITPRAEHYVCMVDLLGRAGYLEEAVDFINKMPFEPDVTVWRTLLGACRTHGNTELGKLTAEIIFDLDAEDATAYVLLSNIYAKSGKWDDVAKVRKVMKDRGIKKEPGCSWIEVKNRVHTFVVGGRSHPQEEKIYAKLERLTEH
eukprot:Gb_23924 [translate_table: standard]